MVTTNFLLYQKSNRGVVDGVTALVYIVRV